MLIQVSTQKFAICIEKVYSLLLYIQNIKHKFANVKQANDISHRQTPTQNKLN